MAPIIFCGWTLLSIIYFTVRQLLKDSATILFLGPPAAEFCQDTKDQVLCNRTDLFSFQISSGIALTACAILGFITWHVNKRSHTALPNTPAGRLYGYLPEAELLAALNFTFQSWDFAISLLIPEHATAIMLSHHLMAATVSWCSIQYQCLHYYGIFFLGLTEVSSIFLVFVDLSKYFPPISNSFFDKFIGLFCAPLFAVTFIYYRVILWWPESYRLFCDVKAVVASGQAQKLRPGSPAASWVLYLFLACNFPLGLLQLYWVTLIVAEIQKILLGH